MVHKMASSVSTKDPSAEVQEGLNNYHNVLLCAVTALLHCLHSGTQKQIQPPLVG